MITTINAALMTRHVSVKNESQARKTVPWFW